MDLLGNEAFDRVEFERLTELRAGVEHFIDVGATHGVYTFYANKFLSHAEIVSTEADPERFAILKENTAKWEAESTNSIRCILAAASDEEDRRHRAETTFFTTGTQINGGPFAVTERSDDYEPITVPLVCVDDLFIQ